MTSQTHARAQEFEEEIIAQIRDASRMDDYWKVAEEQAEVFDREAYKFVIELPAAASTAPSSGGGGGRRRSGDVTSDNVRKLCAHASKQRYKNIQAKVCCCCLLF